MKKIINTPNAPDPVGPYNQAILFNKTLYTSGQIAINPDSKKLIASNIKEETEQVMKNLKAVLKAADMSFNEVVKTSIFITDMNDFTIINEVYSNYFEKKTAPARETVQVAKLPKNARIEISLIAVKGS